MEIKQKWEVDGKYFSDLKLAEDYVKSVEEEKAKKEKLAKEREDRINEIKDTFDKYYELKAKFEKDYPTAHIFPYSLDSLLRFR